MDDEEIKEYHFHIYFYQNNPKSKDMAMELRNEFFRFVSDKLYVVALDKVNEEPVGPHTIGSFEVWCPQEYLAPVLSWFILRRPPSMSILCHPITRYEYRDHTERALWLGEKVLLDTSALSEDLGQVPIQYPEIKLGYSAEPDVISKYRFAPIRPVNFTDDHEDEDEEEYTLNGHEHVNMINNFNPATALASPLMNGDHSMAPTGVVNGEEETLRLLEHGIVEGFVYQQHHSSIAPTIVDTAQLNRSHDGPEIINPAQYANLPFGTEVAPGWIWTHKGLKRKRGRPRKGSAVLIDAEQLAKKQRKKRKKDELNGLIHPSQQRIVGYDGQHITGIVQGPPRNAGKRPIVHPAPVPVVQVLHTAPDQQMMGMANDDQLQGEKGTDWEVIGQGEIGNMVAQIEQVLETVQMAANNRTDNNNNGGKDSASGHEYTYGNEVSYSDLVDTLNEDNRPHPNMETTLSNTNAVHKPIESVIASTLEQELQNNTNETTNTVMDISIDEAPQSAQPSAPAPVTQQDNPSSNNHEHSPLENITTREMQAVLSPLPTTPAPSTSLPHTPMPSTSLPHTPMPVTPLPNVHTPTDPQQPPRPQIDYIHHAPVSTPSRQQAPLEEGELPPMSPPPSFQSPPSRAPQPRTPQPRTPMSPPSRTPPASQPVESSQASQTLVLDDEETVFPSALNGSSDSNGQNSEPQRASPPQRTAALNVPEEAEKTHDYESSNHLTSPSSDDTPRTPLTALLARTNVYENDSDIEIEEEPIAVRRKRRNESRRRERSPSPPTARKRPRTNSTSTPNSTPSTPVNNNNNTNNTNVVALPATEQPVGQLDMTVEQPRRRGRQSRKDKNVNRFESVADLIDLVDD